MLDDTLKSQLQTYLGMLRSPIRLVATLDDSETGVEMRSLLETIVSLSDKVSLDTSGSDARKPSFVVAREGETQGVRFAGLPLGHEFTSLVLALLWTGGHPPKVEQDVLDAIKALDGDFNFEVYMSLSCHNCPDVVQALSLMAIFNPKVKTVVIEGGAFQQEVTEREIMAVPMVFLNGKVFGSGRMSVEEIVAKLDTGAADREAAKLSAKEAFDVLIVGGGPAGAAAGGHPDLRRRATLVADGHRSGHPRRPRGHAVPHADGNFRTSHRNQQRRLVRCSPRCARSNCGFLPVASHRGRVLLDLGVGWR